MGKTYTGDLIRKFRIEKGFTQKQLGERCGINEANIRKYELGYQNPKKETLQKIATALNVSVLDLGVISESFMNALEEFKEEGVKVFISGATMAMGETIDNLEKLNDKGQQKVLEYTKDLLKIQAYKKNNPDVKNIDFPHKCAKPIILDGFRPDS